jgi:hypothetical protein
MEGDIAVVRSGRIGEDGARLDVVREGVAGRAYC